MANVHTTIAPSGNIFAGFFSSIFNVLMAIAEANPRLKEVERLNAMSDDQLARRGLKREDIVHHVFRDCMYV
ncbi:DUF1127 domain-containing protein [Antarctobacter sp.]|uniref:DUF1127 domain-containing protein n=1 Tax=Antarctobacter sp. TaxID=1872577 RepID=UPI003A8DA38A